MNIQSQPQAHNHNQNVPQQTSNTVFFNNQPRATTNCSKNYPFFQRNKNMTIKHHTKNQPFYSEDVDTKNKINKNSVQINKIIIGIMINEILFVNQIFLNHIHETNKYDEQDITQRHITITFNLEIL